MKTNGVFLKLETLRSIVRMELETLESKQKMLETQKIKYQNMLKYVDEIEKELNEKISYKESEK